MADSGAGGGAGASGSLSYHKTIGGALSLKGLGALKCVLSLSACSCHCCALCPLHH